jgi:hypothetical protein
MKKFAFVFLYLILAGISLSFSQVGTSKYTISSRIHLEGDGVAFDPDLGRVYNSNGQGTMTVVQDKKKNNFEVIENFTTMRGARTITLNPKTHKIYLPVAEYEAAPAATTENPRPRASVKANSFMILEISSL